MPRRDRCRDAFVALAFSLSACATSGVPEGLSSQAQTASDPVWTLSEHCLRVSLIPPSRLSYDPQSLSAARNFVGIHVENTGGSSVSIPHVHASYEARREGVAFPCNAHVDVRPGTVEPTDLGPGASFTFERLLDCTLPLTGTYDVRVWLHAAVGEEPGASHTPTGSLVGSFSVEVTANHGNAPHAIPGHQGLYAFMTGSSIAPPTSAPRGHQLLVELVNGGPRPVALQPARLTVLVSIQGVPLPCSGRTEWLREPGVLMPGAIQLHAVSLTCIPDHEGRYEIVGRLALDGEPQVEIGRVGLLVTTYPNFLFTQAG